MKKFAVLAALATIAMLPAVAQADGVKVVEGKMIYSANGKRVGPAYRVKSDGAVEMILDGRLITIPASALSEANGKVTVAQTKDELLSAK